MQQGILCLVAFLSLTLKLLDMQALNLALFITTPRRGSYKCLLHHGDVTIKAFSNCIVLKEKSEFHLKLEPVPKLA